MIPKALSKQTKRYILVVVMFLSFIVCSTSIFIGWTLKGYTYITDCATAVGDSGQNCPTGPNPPRYLMISSEVLPWLGIALALFSVIWEEMTSHALMYSALSGTIPVALAFLFSFVEDPSLRLLPGILLLDLIIFILLLTVAFAARFTESLLSKAPLTGASK